MRDREERNDSTERERERERERENVSERCKKMTLESCGQDPKGRQRTQVQTGVAAQDKNERMERDRSLVMTPDGSIHRKEESLPLPRSLAAELDRRLLHDLLKRPASLQTSEGEGEVGGGRGGGAFVMEEAGAMLVADGILMHASVLHRIMSASLQQEGKRPGTSEQKNSKVSSTIDWAHFYGSKAPVVEAAGAPVSKVTEETIRALEHFKLSLVSARSGIFGGETQQGVSVGGDRGEASAGAGKEPTSSLPVAPLAAMDLSSMTVENAEKMPPGERQGARRAAELIANGARGENPLLATNLGSEYSGDLVAQLLELSRVAGRRVDATITASEKNQHAAMLNSLKPEHSAPSPLASAANHFIQKQPHAIAGGGVALAVRGVSSEPAESRALDIVRRNLMASSPTTGSQRSEMGESQDLGRCQTAHIATPYMAVSSPTAGRQVADFQDENVNKNEIEVLESRRRALLLSLSVQDEGQRGRQRGGRDNGGSVHWQGRRGASQGRRGAGEQETYDEGVAEEDESDWSDSDGYDTEDSFFDRHRTVNGKTEVDLHLEEASRAQRELHAQMVHKRRVNKVLNNTTGARAKRRELSRKLPMPQAYHAGGWDGNGAQGQGQRLQRHGSRVQFDDERNVSEFGSHRGDGGNISSETHVDAVDGFGCVVSYRVTGIDDYNAQTHSHEGMKGIFRDLAPFGLRGVQLSRVWRQENSGYFTVMLLCCLCLPALEVVCGVELTFDLLFTLSQIQATCGMIGQPLLLQKVPCFMRVFMCLWVSVSRETRISHHAHANFHWKSSYACSPQENLRRQKKRGVLLRARDTLK
jgi:hypothetical protein